MAASAASPAAVPLRTRSPTPSCVHLHMDADDDPAVGGMELASLRVDAGVAPAGPKPATPAFVRPKALRQTSSSQLNPPRSYHHNQPAPEPQEEELSPPAPLARSTQVPSRTLSAGLAPLDTSQQASHLAPSTQVTPSGAAPPKSLDAEEAPDLSAYADVLDVSDVERGLTADKVEAQRATYGWNESVEKQTPLWLLFLQKFHGAVPYMILIAMIVSLAIKEWVNGAVIGILLLVNGVLAFHEDLRARKALAELMKTLQVTARVKRDDSWSELPARELVPGDLIRLRTGDLGGADAVVVNGQLSCDTSSLTGESKLSNVKRDGLVYAGSIIKRGEANAVVVATGPRTYFGKTAQLVQASKPNAHIARILTRIVGLLMALILILVVVTLIVMGVRDEDMVDAVPLLLMVIITALPVALPAMFTVSMALGSQELSKRKVLVTRLNVLEDCALMEILFSDKTGTLSANYLTVKSVLPLAEGVSVGDVLLASALCSRRENADPVDRAFLDEFQRRQDGGKEAKPDDVERTVEEMKAEAEAEARAGTEGKYPPPPLEMFHHANVGQYELLKFIPFDATNRRTEALLRDRSELTSPGGSSIAPLYRVCKGAVATLASLSGMSLEGEEYKRIDAIVEENAKKGYRTLAVAGCYWQGDAAKLDALHHDEDDADHDQDALLPEDHAGSAAVPPPGVTYRLMGLVSLHDPPRPDSAAIVARLLSLGVQTKMLTGDALGVACEMGRTLGMGDNIVNLEAEKKLLKKKWEQEELEQAKQAAANSNEVRIKIPEGEAESPEARLLHALLSRFDPLKITGFAQIFPADKHGIVQHAQEKGIVCGMTGDGVNDAPALKQAEVGCAVSNATDVAKGSASALLLDEGLSGVVEMVEVGRQVHKRVTVWVINKIAKACQHSVFILVLFLILGRFPISALGVVLLLLLMDFMLISIATDRQPAGAQPGTWNLAQLTRVGLAIGLPGAGQMLALILVAENHFDQPEDESETMAWLAMFMWGMLSVFAARETGFFWKSRPSTIMLGIVVVEMIAVWLVCSLGVPGLPAIGWAWSTSVLALGLGCFVINDAFKVAYIRVFERDMIERKNMY